MIDCLYRKLILTGGTSKEQRILEECIVKSGTIYSYNNALKLSDINFQRWLIDDNA